MKKKKVIFLQNIIYPIRNPFYEELSKLADFDFKVLFLSSTASNRKWLVSEKSLGYSGRVLKGFRIKVKDQDGFDYSINPFALFDFFKEDPDCVVTWGWANPANIIFMFMCMLLKRPYYIWCENTSGEPSKKRDLVTPFIKFLIKKSKACLVPGIKSEEYIKSLNSGKNIIKIPNAIDIERWKVERSKRNRKRVTLLYVGRLEKIKGVHILLKAIKNIDKKVRKKIKVEIVGYGSHEKELKEYVKKNDLENCVNFVGYVERNKLPDIYRKADVFILPSLREPWGHVVTEAAASGLPLIVSNKVGSSPDLVKHDVNGYIYEPNNIRKLAKYIMKLVYSSKLRKKMGKESEKIASNYNYDRMVKMFLDNLEL